MDWYLYFFLMDLYYNAMKWSELWGGAICLFAQWQMGNVFRKTCLENVIIFVISAKITHLMWRHLICLLIQLSAPASLNANVQPAPLPTTDSDLVGPCTVSGWGVTRLYSFYLSPVLRAVDVEIIPNCQYYYYYRVNDNMICAGSRFGGKDSCQVTKVQISFPQHCSDDKWNWVQQCQSTFSSHYKLWYKMILLI